MRKELTLNANLNSDLWIDESLSAILQKRVSTFAKSLTKSRKDIEYFHTVEFEGRSFREVINKGEKTGSDLILLLQDQETQKFKAWLSNQEPTGHLIREYDRAIFGRRGWTQRLPFKAGKIVAFAGLGVLVDIAIGSAGIATAVSASASAASDIAVGSADEYLGRKLLQGWKPNQFIDGPAKQFMKQPLIR